MSTRFQDGLRVTDEASLKVVVAVLAGLVNKQIVGSLSGLGGRAIGLSGADAGILRARVLDEKLGFVGEITGVDSHQLFSLIEGGLTPVIAPIALECKGEAPIAQLLNINADTAAGAIAAAIGASRLVFLTDVAGVQAGNGAVAVHLSAVEAESLIDSGVVEGGMIPKVYACVAASKAGCEAVIVDGREEHSLLHTLEGQMTGTTVA